MNQIPNEQILIKALEEIRDIAKSWEDRKEAPYWNLEDKAAAALKQYNEKMHLKGVTNA